MWYSIGEINDESLIGMATQSNEGQVDAGRMNYHIIKMLNPLQTRKWTTDGQAPPPPTNGQRTNGDGQDTRYRQQ